VGPQGIGHYVNVYFRADLGPWTEDRPAILYWTLSDDARGVFQPLDARGRWLCQIAYDGRSESFEEYTPERCIEWIRTAVGDATCDAEVLSIGTWTMNAAVAERLAQGRIFLVGDSAHQLPPTGGFGVNTGIQAAHNLAWKLALVREGIAEPSLLETYEVERAAVARVNAQRSLENSRMVAQIGEAASRGGARDAVAASKRYGNFLGMELGFWYESAAVIPDGTDPPQGDDPVSDYVPSARAGHRAPHAWLEQAGRRSSTLDLLGQGFALLAGSEGVAWKEATRDASARAGAGIAAHTIGDGGDYRDVDGDWAALFGVGNDGAVLVRPDGHVAWRSPALPPDPAANLTSALKQVLGRA
jgi:hypothetical protein